MLAITSSAMAATVTFTEDFNSPYVGGTTSWGSGGVWNEPTNGLKLDAYTPDGSLGPRTGGGSTGMEYAHAELAETGVGPMTFSAEFYWDHAKCKEDGFFVVLSDDPATAEQVPASGSLGSPINAIAWGHAATDAKNYMFFDGQSWTLAGYTGQPGGGTNAWEAVSGTVDEAGNWNLEVSATSGGGSGSGAGTLAISDFSFDTVSAVSYEVPANGYFSGIDDIQVNAALIPEPGTLVLLGLGVPMLLLLRRRRA
jgi:hypothetical protein